MFTHGFPIRFRSAGLCLALLLATGLLSGCGTTKSRTATEQLLVSDAVDRSISSIDFTPLAGSTVYLDTQYLKTVKGTGYVNADYIVSSLRQQMLADQCLLEEDQKQADYIAEVRVGALGLDAHDITYGIPPSNSISVAATLVPNTPPLPMIPEIAFAKKTDQSAAAKIIVFAYAREQNRATWQSGIAQAKSSAKDLWIFGAGPLQSGTIYSAPTLAGEELSIPFIGDAPSDKSIKRLAAYSKDRNFEQERKQAEPITELAEVPPLLRPISHQREVDADGAAAAGSEEQDDESSASDLPAKQTPAADK